jgi:hypothetical protein
LGRIVRIHGGDQGANPFSFFSSGHD